MTGPPNALESYRALKDQVNGCLGIVEVVGWGPYRLPELGVRLESPNGL
jgi:hypothetical protein